MIRASGGCLRNAVATWESLQVELKGRYSVDRLLALEQYELRHPSRWRTLIVAALVPVPCLLFMVLMDLLPLGPPSDGFERQRIGFHVRGFVMTAVPAFGVPALISKTIPGLAISRRRLCGIAAVILVVVTLTAFVFSRVIGFPVPFLIHIQSIVVAAMIGVAIRVTWKDQIRADASIRHSVKSRRVVFVLQILVLQVYFAYLVIFKRLPGDVQSYFTIVLQVIKLTFKNLVYRGLDEHDDFAPAFIVSRVDIFHTLFVSLVMENCTTSTTVVFIMGVDTFQNVIALHELSAMVARIHKAAERAAKLTHGSKGATPKAKHQEASRELNDLGVKRVAKQVLATHPQVRALIEAAPLPTERRSVFGSRRHASAITPTFAGTGASLTTKLPSPSDLESAQADFTRLTLKLLRMTEFYVLIEFIEVMMASMYATYLVAISLLPNRVYYSSLAGFTSAAIQAKARVVAGYAALELVSFVVFCFMVQRRVKHHSAMNQLAFALETNWGMIQGPFVNWVFVLFNMSLEHFGTDTTFQFKWLRPHG